MDRYLSVAVELYFGTVIISIAKMIIQVIMVIGLYLQSAILQITMILILGLQWAIIMHCLSDSTGLTKHNRQQK